MSAEDLSAIEQMLQQHEKRLRTLEGFHPRLRVPLRGKRTKRSEKEKFYTRKFKQSKSHGD